MAASTDIDIDFADREKALAGLDYVAATIIRNGERIKHNTGVYFQDIPTDPLDHMAAYGHKEAGRYGYFKLDFLNSQMYENVRDEDHLIALTERDPPWELFEDAEVVAQLNHVASYANVLRKIRPRSVEDLAVCLAIIRPGKKHLIGKPRHVIDKEIWTKAEDDAYFYKRSHALAYALSIVVQLNLMVEQASAPD